VDSTHLGWRDLLRRQWPLIGALLFLVGGEFLGEVGWWHVPGSLVTCALAVLAPRSPFDAALAAATAVLASSVVLRVVGVAPVAPILGALVVAEVAALMAIVAVVVRHVSPARAVAGVALLVAVSGLAAVVRPAYRSPYWRDGYDGPGFVPQAVFGTVLLVVSIGTGLYFRARDRERATAVRAEVAAAQHAERMALARELHDVIAHYVTGMVVHAQAAQAVPSATGEALPIIVRSGNEALTEMRRLVGTLRGTDADAPTATSDLADDVRGVVERSGQPVRLHVDLPVSVPPSLGRSVLRLVQESLTNTRKHAEGLSAVDVSVSVSDN
jgi:signal transduction histidine kinase